MGSTSTKALITQIRQATQADREIIAEYFSERQDEALDKLDAFGRDDGKNALHYMPDGLREAMNAYAKWEKLSQKITKLPEGHEVSIKVYPDTVDQRFQRAKRLGMNISESDIPATVHLSPGESYNATDLLLPNDVIGNGLSQYFEDYGGDTDKQKAVLDALARIESATQPLKGLISSVQKEAISQQQAKMVSGPKM